MKILPLFLFLIAITGCCRSYQRFVPVGASAVVLDTKTGRYCNPVANSPNALSLCYDLYKGKE